MVNKAYKSLEHELHLRCFETKGFIWDRSFFSTLQMQTLLERESWADPCVGVRVCLLIPFHATGSKEARLHEGR